MKKILTKLFLSLLVLVMMAGIIKTSFSISVKASEDDVIVEDGNVNGEDQNSGDSTNGLPGLDDDGDGPHGIPTLGEIPGDDGTSSTNGLPGLDDDGDGPHGIPTLGVNPGEGETSSTNGLPGLDDDGDGPHGIPTLGVDQDPEEETA